jgi:hypothetical protein
MDAWVSCCRDERLAEEAWAQFQGALPDACYSEDFGDGFKAGFADYLYAGGNGEPPPVPPRQYWKAQYETPQGQQMMQDWLRGFRHGAAVARDSGYRETVTVPASASLPRVGSPRATPPLAPTTPIPAKAMPGADDPPVQPKQLPMRPGTSPGTSSYSAPPALPDAPTDLFAPPPLPVIPTRDR